MKLNYCRTSELKDCDETGYRVTDAERSRRSVPTLDKLRPPIFLLPEAILPESELLDTDRPLVFSTPPELTRFGPPTLILVELPSDSRLTARASSSEEEPLLQKSGLSLLFEKSPETSAVLDLEKALTLRDLRIVDFLGELPLCLLSLPDVDAPMLEEDVDEVEPPLLDEDLKAVIAISN